MDVTRLAVGYVHQSHDDVTQSRQRLVDAACLLERNTVVLFMTLLSGQAVLDTSFNEYDTKWNL